MHRVQSILLLTGAAAVAGALACPPYMVIDTATPTRHATLGHHPRWQPPAPAMAEAALEARVGPVAPGTPSTPRVAVNGVRLGIEAGAALIGSVVVLALGPGRHTKGGRGE